MNMRDLVNEVRETIVADPEMMPTRPIVYTRKSDQADLNLNSYVGIGVFNDVEKETIEDRKSFGGLLLEQVPKVGDAVEYDGVVYWVERYSKQGTLYTVYCKVSKKRGRPR